MYSTCLFCHASLGANEMLEHFPVGRRIAFDAARGRLWVICPSCSQWSLSPLDERWEAVEEAERLYRQSKKRVATDQIGLARLKDGTELVRIGEPLRPEFAAWRYGARFRSRWFKQLGWGAAAGAAVTGYIVAGPLMGLFSLGGMWIPWNIASISHQMLGRRRVVANVTIREGAIAMTEWHTRSARVIPRPDLPEGWMLSVQHHWDGPAVGRIGRAWKDSDPRIEVHGERALQVARAILPRINRSGGRARTIEDAVQVLEAAGEPNAAFVKATRSKWRQGNPNITTDVAELDAPVRLALEMAAHEEVERRALDGELAALESAWREAEEVAAIADSLTLPERLAGRIEQMRG